MKAFLKITSYIGLLLTLVPAFFVFYDTLSFDDYKSLMLSGSVLWIVTAPFWIFKNAEKS